MKVELHFQSCKVQDGPTLFHLLHSWLLIDYTYSICSWCCNISIHHIVFKPCSMLTNWWDNIIIIESTSLLSEMSLNTNRSMAMWNVMSILFETYFILCAMLCRTYSLFMFLAYSEHYSWLNSNYYVTYIHHSKQSWWQNPTVLN